MNLAIVRWHKSENPYGRFCRIPMFWSSIQVANETERTTLGCCKNAQYSESEQWIPDKKPLGIPWNLPFFFSSPFGKHIYGACYRVHAIITSILVLNAVNFKPDKGLNETRESACCTAPWLYITCAYECLCKRWSKSDKKLQMNKCMHHL